jgi:flavin reductase
MNQMVHVQAADRPAASFPDIVGQHELLEPFKRSMRLFASTVAVITTAIEGRRSGLTATAVCSLSMEPPMLLVCVNRESRTHPVIDKAGAFCVNLLAEEHVGLASLFAASDSSAEEKFAAGDWITSENGLPVLRNSMASIECRVRRQIDEGTHTIFVGAVVGVVARPDLGPLLYANHRFGRIDYAN